MKKLLLATGILALSCMAFAGDEEAPEVEHPIVNVFAEVVKDLEVVKKDDVDFGVLIRGQQDKKQELAGHVYIKGEKEKKILVFAKDYNNANTTFTNIVDSNTIIPTVLYGKDTTNTKTDTMTSNLRIVVEDFALDSAGEKTLTIVGTTSATDNQEFGHYEGQIQVKVIYDSVHRPETQE